MTNFWPNYNEKPKLTPYEKRSLKVRYCKQCGAEIPFLDRSKFCIKCRPKYPSDKYIRGGGEKKV